MPAADSASSTACGVLRRRRRDRRREPRAATPSATSARTSDPARPRSRGAHRARPSARRCVACPGSPRRPRPPSPRRRVTPSAHVGSSTRCCLVGRRRDTARPALLPVERSHQRRRVLERLEQRRSLYPQHRAVRLRGDRGVAGRVVEQPALAEASPGPQCATHFRVSMDDDASRRRPRRRRAPELPFDDDVDARRSGHSCDAEASCSSTIRGTPAVIGSRSMTASREASASARFRLSSSSPRSPRRQSTVTRTRGDAEDDEARAERGRGRSAPARARRPHHRATDTASNTPITRPRTSAGDDAGEGRLRDHLAGDEAGAADQRSRAARSRARSSRRTRAAWRRPARRRRRRCPQPSCSSRAAH